MAQSQLRGLKPFGGDMTSSFDEEDDDSQQEYDNAHVMTGTDEDAEDDEPRVVDPQAMLESCMMEYDESESSSQFDDTVGYYGAAAGNGNLVPGSDFYDEASTSNDTSFTFGDSNMSCSDRCPVCQTKSPTRLHLAEHFMLELEEPLQGLTNCTLCNFVGDSASDVVLHQVEAHDGLHLEQLLQDHDLVRKKRDELRWPASEQSAQRSSGKRAALSSGVCPICAQTLHKQHARDHVAWHFMEELRAEIGGPEVTNCPEPGCIYSGDKSEAVARHLALFHCRLDRYLEDEELVEEKRQKAMSKPKKVTIGPSCMICGLKEPSREHVSRHFMKELMEVVSGLEDQLQCPNCVFRGEKPQNLARHIALVHSKLDELLADEDLVQERIREFANEPKKLAIGPNCPVCDQALSKQHSRVHVIWHFMEELREIVSSFRDPQACDLCEYSNPSLEKVAKHIALGHSKLDELLQDEDLLMKKRSRALSTPKKVNVGPACPICNVSDPPREHVARHFGDELNQHVAALADPLSCDQCSYRGEKPKSVGIHIALVHGLLDIFLANPKLVREKRSRIASTPRKQTIGPQCPICDQQFTKSQNRDHVSWHFMDELREYVQSFPDPSRCMHCSYSSEKMDNLVKHVALGHSKLDELLQDGELVMVKRAKAMSKPKKVSIGPTCPVCNIREPAREHVARHFSDELMEVVSQFDDQYQCPDCNYRGDKPKTLAIHIALVHGKLDILLLDQDLLTMKRIKYFAKPQKMSIGPSCPVCDMPFTKGQNRDHVSWHYMDELRAIVQQFPDPSQCTQCSYTADSSEKMVKHVALGHSMLDEFLQDEQLLISKRMKALSKPKKVSLGPTCPVCDVRDPPREHVSRHFGDELMDIVLGFPDQTRCTECNYASDKPKNVSIHIALVHNILDKFLANEELVQEKRERFYNKPQKVSIGMACPICEQPFSKAPNRDHVCWHFMDELREIVNSFSDTTMCPDCPYTADKVDNMVRHVALGHSKLDELLQDDMLVAQKREIAMTKPKKVTIGMSCPICEVKFSKSQNRDHVSWHFMDELRDFVHSTGSDRQCQICNYCTDKLDNLVKHYALGHSKLDELLLDDHLVAAKRQLAKKKPKKLNFGPDCPICGQKGRDRDHIARHFMNELMDLVSSLPRKGHCNECSYKNSRPDYLAKHLALFHCKLDEFMLDEDLVNEKKAKIVKKPTRMSMGDACVICNCIMPSREHVARHFYAELVQIVTDNSPSPRSCYMCSFSAEKAEYVARHVAIVHCKLEEILMDGEMVARKIAEFNGLPHEAQLAESTDSTPSSSAATTSPSSPAVKVMPLRDSVRKSARMKELEVKKEEEERKRKRGDSDFEWGDEAKKKRQEPRKSTPVKIEPYDSNDHFSIDSYSMTQEDDSGSYFDDSEHGESLLKQTLLRPDTSDDFAPSILRSTLQSPLAREVKPRLHNPLLAPPALKRSPAVSQRPVNPLLANKKPSNPLLANKLNPLLTAGAPLRRGPNPLLASTVRHNPLLTKRPPPPLATKPRHEMWTLKTSKPKVSSGALTMVLKRPPADTSPQAAGQVTIKRATQAKWQVKSSNSNNAKAFAPNEIPPPPPLLIAPNAKPHAFQQTLAPEVNYDYEEVEEEGQEEEEEEDEDSSLFEPQVILDTSTKDQLEEVDDDADDADDASAEEDSAEEEEEEEQDNSAEIEWEEEVDVFCDNCGFETTSHGQASICPWPRRCPKPTVIMRICPVCDRPMPSMEHVAKHFSAELEDIVQSLADPECCPQCEYTCVSGGGNMALHLGLAHAQLEKCLHDDELVAQKKSSFTSQKEDAK